MSASATAYPSVPKDTPSLRPLAATASSAGLALARIVGFGAVGLTSDAGYLWLEWAEGGPPCSCLVKLLPATSLSEVGGCTVSASSAASPCGSLSCSPSSLRLLPTPTAATFANGWSAPSPPASLLLPRARSLPLPSRFPSGTPFLAPSPLLMLLSGYPPPEATSGSSWAFYYRYYCCCTCSCGSSCAAVSPPLACKKVPLPSANLLRGTAILRGRQANASKRSGFRCTVAGDSTVRRGLARAGGGVEGGAAGATCAAATVIAVPELLAPD